MHPTLRFKNTTITSRLRAAQASLTMPFPESTQSESHRFCPYLQSIAFQNEAAVSSCKYSSLHLASRRVLQRELISGGLYVRICLSTRCKCCRKLSVVSNRGGCRCHFGTPRIADDCGSCSSFRKVCCIHILYNCTVCRGPEIELSVHSGRWYTLQTACVSIHFGVFPVSCRPSTTVCYHEAAD